MMEITRLPNGLTVVTDPMAHVDSAAIGVWVRAGARSEKDAEHGAAHFLEHMAFKGTNRRTARQISETIETVGGEINAATSIETTAYHARVLADDVPLALDILSDILTDPLFAEDDIARECNVILQEIGAAEDLPEDRAFDAFPEAAFASQPVGRRILGTRDSVGAINRDLLGGFFKRHYKPDALTVVAAGAVDHDRLVPAVEAAFAPLGGAGGDGGPAARYTGGAYSETSEGAEGQWLLGFEGVAANTPDATVAHVASMALGGGMSSRLFQALREDRGLVYDTSAFHWALEDTGLFGIHFATEPASMDEAAAVVLDELEATAANLTDEECERAKAQLRAGLLMSRESCASRMGYAARSAMVHGRLLSKEERLEDLARVDANAVRGFIETMAAGAPTMVAIGTDAAPHEARIRARFGAPIRGAA
ncbi:pitrilysin family protein [Acuticoccus sp. MNP-M23]|uniref:M16 family metallopeptidase n=1 Tax=Acuticoccus sp. MNP-M23 TaxID=3072793 RepID=UPI002815E26D|nr:pitrilysin family protein [Acuticoccus sp. MNP-M23]WMS44855.1 pitrilysin family protein [Acuticoccus sp. MNP-M23]